MYRDELQTYAERHGFTIEKIYYTLGEVRQHVRAIVIDNKTREKNYLYYDSTKQLRKRCTNCKHSRTLHRYHVHECSVSNCVCSYFSPRYKSRGWRNTTQENKRRVQIN